MRRHFLVATLVVLTTPLVGCTGVDQIPDLPNVNRLPFENPQFAGLCEDMIADFADGEPSPFSTRTEAELDLVATSSVLEGLDLVDGQILLRGERVGSYSIVNRPGGTFDIESAEWCYPEQ